jgi:hypothetical protein
MHGTTPNVEDGIPTQVRENEFPEGEPGPRPRAWSCFPTPFTLMNGCSKNLAKTAISAILGTFGAACRRQGSFGNRLQHHKIGQTSAWPGHSKTDWV